MDDWLLDPEVVHLNHGSFGALTRRTWELLSDARLRVERNPMRFYMREYEAAWRRAVAAAEVFLGATAGTVALVDNATAGTDLALRAARLSAGDVVVTTDHGYAAVDRNLTQWRDRFGVRRRVVPVPVEATDDEVVAAVEEASDGATAVVLDHIASPSGRRMPVERLVPSLRSRGLFVFVDGAHAPGQIPLDLDALAPDVWVGNVHKWPGGPRGSALLYVHPDRHDTVPPVLPSSFAAERFPDNAAWQGTRDAGPMLVLPEVLDAAASRLADREVIERIGRLADDGQRSLAAALGVDAPRYPTGWMRTVPVPAELARAFGDDPRVLHDAIAARGVEVAVYPLAGGLHLRASTHVYTTAEDHDRLAEVVADLR